MCVRTGLCWRKSFNNQSIMKVFSQQPIEFLHRGIVSPLDYQLYVDRQLVPAADTILHFIGMSFMQIIDFQLSLV